MKRKMGCRKIYFCDWCKHETPEEKVTVYPLTCVAIDLDHGKQKSELTLYELCPKCLGALTAAVAKVSLECGKS